RNKVGQRIAKPGPPGRLVRHGNRKSRTLPSPLRSRRNLHQDARRPSPMEEVRRKRPKMKWGQAFRLAAGLLPGALFLASCPSKPPEKKQFLVAFSQCNNAEPYRAAQNALMEKLFAEAGDVKLVIADAQQDNSKQVAQVETF